MSRPLRLEYAGALRGGPHPLDRHWTARSGEAGRTKPTLYGLPSGANAWNVQEKAKGTSRLAALLAGDSAGGWGFNDWPDCVPDVGVDCTTQSLSQAEAAAITEEALRERPFFKAFQNAAILDPTAGSENARIAHPHVLAYEIPALSYAAGGTNVGRIANTNKRDMNTFAIQTGWPQERIDKYGKPAWWHSDFKDVAYRYVYSVFDEMVSRGNLQ